MNRQPDPDRPPQPLAGVVEDYTVPFLVVAGVLCFVVLFAIWATAGMAAVLVVSVLAELAMR